MKRVITVLLVVLTLVSLAACGDSKRKNLEGSTTDILNKVYENAALSNDMRESMQYYQTQEITKDSAKALIGTADVDYKEGIYSAPMMSAVAYQCIILRMNEGADIEAAKAAIEENADPIKWVCVQADSVVVENVGDVILFLMADKDTADAVKQAFLALGE